MANGFTIPTIVDLQARIAADINGNVQNEDATIRRSALWASSWALAGSVWGLYKVAEFIADQIIPSTSKGTYLRRWASLFGVTPSPATYSTGQTTITGTPTTFIPSGTTWRRRDGVRYQLDGDATIGGGGSVAADIVAIVAGASGNTDAGTLLDIEGSLAGVDATSEVTAEIANGLDEESDTSVSSRLSERVKRPPQGGAKADYVLWARAALPGVVDQVWVAGGVPAQGQVTAWFSVVYDGADPASVLPTGGQVAEVQAYIDPLIPMDCDGFTAAAPTANPIDVTINLVDDTTDNRTAVREQLVLLFQRRGAADGTGTTILNSEIRAAIGRGSDRYLVTSVDGDGIGTADVTQALGVLPHLGTVTWL